MKSNFLKKTVSMALVVTMCSGIACSAGFLTKAAELEKIEDNIVAAQSLEVQTGLTSQVGANVGDRFEVDGLTYRVTDETSVAVVSYDSRDINLDVPATVSYNQKLYKVTSIGDYAFYKCTNLHEINLPDSITSIENFAFACCTSLQSVHLSDSITSISACVFYDCESLQTINLPDSITSIKDFAFQFCSSLKGICLPNSLTYIGICAFASSGLTKIYLPNSLTSIGNGAFARCKNLRGFTAPAQLKSDIKEREVFEECNKFKLRNIRYY